MQLHQICLIVVFIVCIAQTTVAQQPDTTRYSGIEEINQQIESQAERSDTEIDYSDWEEELGLLRIRPVNLNSGDENEIRRLFFLNELQIINLLEYTNQYGSLVSIYELQVIDGFNEKLVNQILPFITLSAYVPEKFELKKALKYGKTEALFRYQRVLQQQKGYISLSDSLRRSNPNSYYLGDQNSLFMRVQYTYKDYVKLGFVGDKDAGETLISRYDTIKRGFDFYSAHIFIKNIGLIKQLAIGDYHVQFGQGLTMWSGFSMGKAAGSVLMRKRAPALRPHSSSNEYAFMRGAATTIALGKFDITALYSNRRVDANVIRSDSAELSEDMITTFQQSGYHRTLAELADKKALHEVIEGGHIAFNGQRFRPGITLFHVDYDLAIEKPSEVYKKFLPAMGSNTYLGLDYTYNFKSLTLYGEASKQFHAGLAFLQGLSFRPDPRMAFAMIYRNYPKNYLNTFNAAFGESSNSTNEKGLYLGIVSTPYSKITLSAYADLFKYEWLRYRTDAPSEGQEYAAQCAYTISRLGDLVYGYRYSVNQINFAVSNEKTNQIGESKRAYHRIQFNYQALPWLKLQSRIEITLRKTTVGTKEKGHIMYQGIQIKPLEKSWTLSMRYQLFDTDSYDTRLYTFEQDVPYSFSIPAFSGKGSRFYLLLNKDFGRNISLIIRYSQTYYSDRNSISSGLDEIEGSQKSDIKAVLKVRF